MAQSPERADINARVEREHSKVDLVDRVILAMPPPGHLASYQRAQRCADAARCFLDGRDLTQRHKERRDAYAVKAHVARAAHPPCLGRVSSLLMHNGRAKRSKLQVSREAAIKGGSPRAG